MNRGVGLLVQQPVQRDDGHISYASGSTLSRTLLASASNSPTMPSGSGPSSGERAASSSDFRAIRRFSAQAAFL